MLCYIPREYMYLDILHVFYTYPKRVQDTFWDTHQIHQDTCILGASLVSHWIHVRIHQDTCILDSSSRYIKIHRDTKLRYMYLERVMTTLQDTIRIHHDTYISRGHGAQRGERKSKREHGSTQPRKTQTPTSPQGRSPQTKYS